MPARHEAQLRRLIAGDPARVVTTTATLTSADRYVRADASGGAFTVTLAPADTMLAQTVVVKKTETSANAVTIAASGTDTIDGAATTSCAGGARSVRTLRSTGTGWDLIA